MPASGETGYLALLKGNTSFRRLWLGNVISLFGDWFNTIALYSLILDLTGSEFALGAVFITKMLPWAIASPIAGLLVDRFDRRRVMIVTDLLRAVVVLGFLLIDEKNEVYLVYVFTTLQVVIGSAFHPAQTASIPNITTKKELVTANTLMAATWSILLTMGAAIGGVAAAALGLKTVFLIDSATYVLSAYFIFRTVIPQATDRPVGSVGIRTAIREVLDGWRHLKRRPRVGRIALAKATWAVAGGALVYMLALMGETIAPGQEAAAIGILFAARGLGTGIGPIVARAVFKQRRHWPALLGGGIIFSGVSYSLVFFLPWTFLVAIPIVLAHASSGANWVFSTVMLQERTEDRFRGRVFATEWLLIMTTDTVSILAASLVLESGILILRQAVLLFACIQVVTGLIWLLKVVPREREDDIELFQSDSA